jgi:predicted anti-sigma-YlaC factor YlaD
MKPHSRKTARSVRAQSRVRNAPQTWRRWLAVQLLILLVSSGGTITVTVGDIGRMQVQVRPAASHTG